LPLIEVIFAIIFTLPPPIFIARLLATFI
jgi:hypothetical protein